MVECHRMDLHMKLFQDCCSRGHFCLESSFCYLSRRLPATTEGTDQQAQLLPSHMYFCISHQEDFQRSCLGILTETHPAGYLPCNVNSVFMYFSDAISQESLIWEARHLSLISPQSQKGMRFAGWLENHLLPRSRGLWGTVCIQAHHHCQQQELCVRWEFRSRPGFFFPIIGVRILQDYQQGDDIKKDSRMQPGVSDLWAYTECKLCSPSENQVLLYLYCGIQHIALSLFYLCFHLSKSYLS